MMLTDTLTNVNIREYGIEKMVKNVNENCGYFKNYDSLCHIHKKFAAGVDS